MNTQNNMPVWMRAFYGWADQMMSEWSKRTDCDPDEVGMSHCENESREFVANMDWDVCKYCLGPCGDCKEKSRRSLAVTRVHRIRMGLQNVLIARLRC